MSKIACKRSLSILLVIFIFSISNPFVFAAGQAQSNIRLDDAVSMAIGNSYSLKELESNIELSEKIYKLAVEDAEKYSGKFYANDALDIENEKRVSLYPQKRLSELNELKWKKAVEEINIEARVIKLFCEITKINKIIDLENKKINLLNEEYRIKEKEYDLGKEIETSLSYMMMDISQAEDYIFSLERDKKMLIMSLNMELGFDVDSNTEIDELDIDELSKMNSDFGIINLEEIIEKLKSSSHNIRKLERDLQFIHQEKDIAKRNSISATEYQLERLLLPFDIEINRLEHQIKSEKISLEYKIRTDYNNILNALDNIHAKELDVKKSNHLENVAKLKFNNGIINEIGYKAAQLSSEQARLNYFTAIVDYNIKLIEFNVFIKSNMVDSESSYL